jgi:glucan phosphoethanolaminetransferase (alkaline phosphatase superfamily)
MTYIQDVADGDSEHLERLRREILGNVESRRQEANNAFSEMCKFCGIVYSGGTIAILSFIGSRKEGKVPTSAVVSFSFFVVCLLSFAVFLFCHSQLHAARWEHYADVAHKFFTRQSSLEDVIKAGTELQSTWLYQLLFWVPFTFVVLGFVFGGVAALRMV